MTFSGAYYLHTFIQDLLSTMIYSLSYLLWESIYLLIGRPRPPRFTSDTLGYRPHSYNITWTTDSYEPISEYKLLYRRSDVSIHCSKIGETGGNQFLKEKKKTKNFQKKIINFKLRPHNRQKQIFRLNISFVI